MIKSWYEMLEIWWREQNYVDYEYTENYKAIFFIFVPWFRTEIQMARKALKFRFFFHIAFFLVVNRGRSFTPRTND